MQPLIFSCMTPLYKWPNLVIRITTEGRWPTCSRLNLDVFEFLEFVTTHAICFHDRPLCLPMRGPLLAGAHEPKPYPPLPTPSTPNFHPPSCARLHRAGLCARPETQFNVVYQAGGPQQWEWIRQVSLPFPVQVEGHRLVDVAVVRRAHDETGLVAACERAVSHRDPCQMLPVVPS